MIIRFGGEDLKIYTPSSVFRYTFISLSKYVFARTEPKYSQKNIWANNNYHDNERILSKFAPCRVGNRKTLRGFQTDAALIDTAGLEEEGKQASCRTLALCTGQLLSAHRILICTQRTHYWTAGLQGYTKNPATYNGPTDGEAPSHQKVRRWFQLVSAPNWLQEQASSFPVS